MDFFKFFFFLLLASIYSSSYSQDLVLGEFGAFYCRIHAESAFEKIDKVREHPDIIVDLGNEKMKSHFQLM